MDDAEAGDEAADERVIHPEPDGQVLMEPRIHRPEPRPRNDCEEQSGLDAVEGKEERHRHWLILANQIGRIENEE